MIDPKDDRLEKVLLITLNGKVWYAPNHHEFESISGHRLAWGQEVSRPLNFVSREKPKTSSLELADRVSKALDDIDRKLAKFSEDIEAIKESFSPNARWPLK